MIKVLLSIIVLTSGLNSFSQDIYFGVNTGYMNVQSSGNVPEEKQKLYGSGIYLGGLIDIYLNDEMRLQPALNIGHVLGGTNLIHFPLMVKYYILDYGFNVQAGPQVTFLVGADNGTKDQFGWDLGAGMGIDITKQIFLEGRYTYEISNRKENFLNQPEESFRFSGIMLGLGYRFIR
jgi:opacity protein-like surface antigen